MTNDVANYDLIVVDPPTYARALAETKRAEPPPHRIAKSIASAMTGLASLMHEQETGCAICDGEDAYVFAVAEAPIEFLCCVPVEGSDATPIAGPSAKSARG